MAQEIELRTGGLGVSAHVVSNPSDLNAFEQVKSMPLILELE